MTASVPDFRLMTPEQFTAWQLENGGQPAGLHSVRVPEALVTPADVAQSYAAARELAGTSLVAPGNPEPAQQPTARPAAEIWGKPNTFDFTCPSGAMCQMKKLEVQVLLEAGIIDKISRLPGIAQDLIDKAEMAVPTAAAQDQMPTPEEVELLTTLLSIIVPMAVVQPQVFATPAAQEERVAGRIYLDSIDLEDRIAIMNRALEGVVKLDDFRPSAGKPS